MAWNNICAWKWCRSFPCRVWYYTQHSNPFEHCNVMYLDTWYSRDGTSNRRRVLEDECKENCEKYAHPASQSFLLQVHQEAFLTKNFHVIWSLAKFPALLCGQSQAIRSAYASSKYWGQPNTPFCSATNLILSGITQIKASKFLPNTLPLEH